MYHIVIFGAPGSGKGTQAELLVKKYNLEHIATGDLFRQEIAKQTKLGKEIDKVINAGNLVSDDIVNEIVLEKLKLLKSKNKGFILDGYPRDLNQAKALAVVKLDFVFFVDISDEESIKRISNRLVCSCGATYNAITNPPKVEGICDRCNGKLTRRDDEDETVVKNRLEVFHKVTDPLIKYYQEKDLLYKIDGDQTIPAVASDINKIINKFAK